MFIFFALILIDMVNENLFNLFLNIQMKIILGKQQKNQVNQQAIKGRNERYQPFGPFPSGRKSIVEKSPLIKHSGAKSRQEELHRAENQERAINDTENQAFLKDVRS